MLQIVHSLRRHFSCNLSTPGVSATQEDWPIACRYSFRDEVPATAGFSVDLPPSTMYLLSGVHFGSSLKRRVALM